MVLDDCAGWCWMMLWDDGAGWCWMVDEEGAGLFLNRPVRHCKLI